MEEAGGAGMPHRQLDAASKTPKGKSHLGSFSSSRLPRTIVTRDAVLKVLTAITLAFDEDLQTSRGSKGLE
jgi:hypothetical protein